MILGRALVPQQVELSISVAQVDPILLSEDTLPRLVLMVTSAVDFAASTKSVTARDESVPSAPMVLAPRVVALGLVLSRPRTSFCGPAASSASSLAARAGRFGLTTTPYTAEAEPVGAPGRSAIFVSRPSITTLEARRLTSACEPGKARAPLIGRSAVFEMTTVMVRVVVPIVPVDVMMTLQLPSCVA